MKFVIDTNVLIVSISSKSKYHWLYKKIIGGEIEICVSNEILNEYSEKITQFFNNSVAENVIASLLSLENVKLTDIYFNWKLINNDPSDNKFVDCAVASNSNALVTNDRHFSVLKQIVFPRVETITLQEFEKLIIK